MTNDTPSELISDTAVEIQLHVRSSMVSFIGKLIPIEMFITDNYNSNMLNIYHGYFTE